MTFVQPDLPVRDICARLHRGNAESEAAFKSIKGNLSFRCECVLAAIKRAGAHGLSAKDLAADWNVGLNTISGRFSDLKKANLIRKVSVRDASGVYVAEGGAL